MSVTIEFHPDAAEEALEAHQWYAERSARAAERFRGELDRAIENISKFPDRYPRDRHGVRVFMMRRFPYLVIFKEYADHVKIVAVAHGHRRPGYWKQRLKH